MSFQYLHLIFDIELFLKLSYGDTFINFLKGKGEIFFKVTSQSPRGGLLMISNMLKFKSVFSMKIVYEIDLLKNKTNFKKFTIIINDLSESQ